MIKIINIRKTFVHQLGEADCGIACLRSLLGYAGLPNDLVNLQNMRVSLTDGLSLLDLRKAATAIGLKGRCVEMDMEHLRQSPNPCILYVLNESGQGHFVVHYGAKRTSGEWLHILGDPASHVYETTESKINKIWNGRTALYFDDFPIINKKWLGIPWKPLFSLNVFPRQLWLVIPFLSITSTLLGVATSLTLEKGSELTLFGNTTVIFAVMGLLSLIILFKTLISFVRQRALITMNVIITEKLVSRAIHSLTKHMFRAGELPSIKLISSLLMEVNLIQQAFYTIVSVMLSEGLIVVGILSFFCYEMPVVALLMVMYLIALLFYTCYHLPSISYRYAHVHQLEYNVEHQIQKIIFSNAKINDGPEIQECAPDVNSYLQYLDHAKIAAFLSSTVGLGYELMGTVLITMTISYEIFLLYHHAISYNLFLAVSILSYLSSTIVPKIGNALFVVTEAAEMTRKLKDRLSTDQ